MAYLPESLINDIRQQVDIVDVVNQYVQLTKRGTNYMASCPFHEDRNPSFSVSPSKQIYKCFSCGRGGNVFSFLQEIEGIHFVEAVKKAAEFANIRLPDEYMQNAEPDSRQIYQVLYDIHQKVADFYHYYLTSTVPGDNGLQYLIQRGLSQDTLKQFKLGLAPTESSVLVNFLLQEGYKQEELVDSRIFYSREDGQLVDRFRGRIMIPLADAKGDIVGFSGRIYLPNQTDTAKYLNSPQTPIFDKSQLLFNLHQARQPIRNQDSAIVLEGFMDVIALYEAGLENAVATMGTSLTQSHLKQLTRHANTIYFVFDGDEAGQKATARAFDLAMGINQASFKSVTIPGGLDPDEFVRQRGVNVFNQLLHQAESSFEFLANYLKRQYNLHDDQEKAKYIEAVLKLIVRIESPIEREIRLKDLAQTQDVSLDILEEQLERLRHATSQSYEFDSSPPDSDHFDAFYAPSADVATAEMVVKYPIESKQALQSEKYIFACLMQEDAAWDYLGRLSHPVLLFNTVSREAYLCLQTYYYDEGYPMPLSGAIDTIDNTAVRQLLTDVMWELEIDHYTDKIMEDCLKVIEKAFIDQEIKELMQQVKEAQKQQDHQQLMELSTRITSLTRQLKL